MIGLIARREIIQRIRSRGFWLTTIITPLLLLVVLAATSLIAGPVGQPIDELIDLETIEGMIGYVDPSGLIQSIPYPAPEDTFQAYQDEAAARSALELGEISAYYVIPSDYGPNRSIQRYSEDIPASAPDNRWMSWILVKNIFPDRDFQSTAQLRWPFNSQNPEFVNLSTEGQAESTAGPLVPLLLAAALVSPLFSSGSYLLQSLAEEKRNRILEILITSTNTRQMFWGKLAGLGVITIVQYAIWISLGVILYRANPGTNRMVSLDMGLLEFLQFLPFMLGGYLLFAGLMAGIGALTPPDQNSRAWVLLITLPLILPIYLWSIIVRAPNGALALFMSLFPLTSPVTMTMRMITTMVPPWQILVSALLLIATGIATVQVMARIFRETILLSGEQLSLRRLTTVFLRKD